MNYLLAINSHLHLILLSHLYNKIFDSATDEVSLQASVTFKQQSAWKWELTGIGMFKIRQLDTEILQFSGEHEK